MIDTFDVYDSRERIRPYPHSSINSDIKSDDDKNKKSLKIVNTNFEDYPEELKKVLADNNSLWSVSYDEYYAGWWRPRFKEENLPVASWIYIGDNIDQLIKGLLGICEEINYVTTAYPKYNTMSYNDRKEDFAASNPEGVILTIVVKINGTKYPVSLFYKSKYYASRKYSRFLSDKNTSSSFYRNYAEEQRKKFKELTPRRILEESVKHFVKMCREHKNEKI